MPTRSYYDWILTDIFGNDLTITSTGPDHLTLAYKSTKDIERKIPGIKQIVFNKEKGYTTVLWNDGSATVVHCGEGDHFERYYGFCAAVIKKLFGSTTAAKNLIEKYDLEKNKERKEIERQQKVAAQLEMERKNRERKENQKKIQADQDEFIKKLLDNIAALKQVIGGDTDGD